MVYSHGYKIYSADDEEPMCINCDVCDSCDGEGCGGEYGWAKYARTAIIVDEITQKIKEYLIDNYKLTKSEAEWAIRGSMVEELFDSYCDTVEECARVAYNYLLRNRWQ